MKSELVGNIELIPLQVDDIIDESEDASTGNKTSDAELERYKPNGAQFKR